MPDWTELLTKEERETERRWRYGDGPVQRDIQPLLHTVATLRALVEEKGGALRVARPVVIWAGSTVGTAIEKVNNEQGQHEKRILAQIDEALALTESDIIETLNE